LLSPSWRTARKKRQLERLEARFQRAHAKLLQDRVSKLVSQAQRDMERLREREMRELRNRPDYAGVRARFEELKAIDGSVVALLDRYRSLLLERARELGSDPVFTVDDLSLPTQSIQREIDDSSYERKNLVLGYA
jgi:hypothetical protein